MIDFSIYLLFNQTVTFRTGLPNKRITQYVYFGHSVLNCVSNENYTFGAGVRNYLRAVRKGLRTPASHSKSVTLK